MVGGPFFDNHRGVLDDGKRNNARWKIPGALFTQVQVLAKDRLLDRLLHLTKDMLHRATVCHMTLLSHVDT